MAHLPEKTQRKPNRLAKETSPYLLQHAYNPVDWYPWGPEALETARREDKPIFLSIGYSTCHWCHVMERESFEDESVAAILNEQFVPIKVDREERPDLDEIYMQAVQILTGQGGWPLTVFLDPDLKPFYGGTYFPPEDAYNRPGFPRLLQALSKAYRERRDEVEASSGDLSVAVSQSLTDLVRSGSVDWPTLKNATRTLLDQYDSVYGGFGGAPKFPSALAIQLLLREYARTHDARLLEAAERTLDFMARGGVFDHVGGGFHRYSTDRQWLVPHFEKMLYDNALLTTAYVEAYQMTGNPDFADTARRTVEFVLREMTSPDGGFYSAMDADSEGEEGKFYVWSPAQAVEALGDEDGRLFRRVYGITEAGNFTAGASIPNLSSQLADWATLNGFDLHDLSSRLASMRARLLEARGKRVRPGLDDKVIVSWNGLMISALALAGRVLDCPDYVDAAAKAASFLLNEVAPQGNLAHTWRAGQAKGRAYQDDYACLINALTDLYQADPDERWLRQARRLADEMIAKFWDKKGGGFFFAEEDHGTPIVRSKNPTDGVTPSGNSAAALGLAKLSRLLDRRDFWQIAEEAIQAFGGLMSQASRAFDNLLVAASFTLSEPQEIVLAGKEGSPGMRSLEEVLRHTFLPSAVLARTSGGDQSLPLLQGKTSGDAAAAAYICRNYACKEPVYTADALRDMLKG